MNYQITKVEENNVEIVYSKLVPSVDNGDIEVFDDTTKQSYGEQRVKDDLANLDSQEVTINAYDKEAELQKVQDKRDILMQIKDALENKEKSLSINSAKINQVVIK